MPHETPSPLDLPEPDLEDGSGLGWTSGVIAVAALLLLLTNAVSLRDWINEQPPGPLQARASALADGWVAFTDGIGWGKPRAMLHEQWKRAEEARFPSNGDQPAADQR